MKKKEVVILTNQLTANSRDSGNLTLWLIESIERKEDFPDG